MSDQGLFNNDPLDVSLDDIDTVEIKDGEDYVSALVGEDKKFKDIQALAAGKMQSDTFIQKLISELRTEREKLAALQKASSETQSMSELMEQLRKQTSGNDINDDAGNDPSDNNQNTEGRLTDEQIAEIVEQRLTERETRATAASNLQKVKQTLTEKWGANYQARLQEKSDELGLGPEFLNDLAASKPDSFLTIVGAKDAVAQQSDNLFTPPASHNIATKSGVSDTRNYSFYEKLRKSDPDTYSSPKIQMEMMDQATKLGPDFYK